MRHTKPSLSGKILFTFLSLILLPSFLQATVINIPADQPTIQTGIDAAVNSDTVLVQPGIYLENINYNGKIITVASLFLTTQDTTYISQTIIDANHSGRVVTFENGEISTAVLCGFTIRYGYTSYGGGIYCRFSSPSLQNLIISGNYATDGGGINCSGASPSLENVTITGNFANYDGGGIKCGGGNPSLVNVSISNNSALAGGGIFLRGSNPSLQYVTITGNIAGGRGGGIVCYEYSDPSLQYVTISGNSLFSEDSKGGGIYCAYISNLSIENATITDNIADSGGGIYCDYSTTILRNCILWNDSPQEIYLFNGGSVSATYSDIEGGWAGTGNINEDPLFSNPGNGDYHLSWVNFPIPDATMSPCIDTGDPASPNDPDGTIIEMGSYYFDQFLNADFTADITDGEVPLIVNFTDLSTPGAMDEWYWDYGDGNNSSLQNPAHEYLLPGNYTVSLTVTADATTNTETKVDYITVNSTYNGPVWHISTTGSDITGVGSELNPFATIQHGIDTSSDTETVLVQPGTYVENINYNGKLITVGSLLLTTQDPTYISSTIIDGNASDCVVTFINVEDTTAVLTGFTITNGSGSNGGGIDCYSSSPSLENLLVSGNSTTNYGGGIYIWADSNPDLQNVTITGNSAAMVGGGISCWDSSPSLENVTISGNSAEMHGGGLHFTCSNSSLQNVTISGNSAIGGGGGIYCSGSSPSLVNVSISNNSSGGGGGYEGGGIICANSTPILINSILWNDSPQEIYILSGSATATYSNIEGGWAGEGNDNVDPLFVDPDNSDYHLQVTSPCIDAGDPASPYDPDGTIADMGAFYYHQTIPPDPPQNVTVEVIDTDVHLSWDAVTGANSYVVYSSDYPYSDFVEDSSGSFVGESWTAPLTAARKYYYVRANNVVERPGPY